MTQLTIQYCMFTLNSIWKHYASVPKIEDTEKDSFLGTVSNGRAAMKRGCVMLWQSHPFSSFSHLLYSGDDEVNDDIGESLLGIWVGQLSQCHDHWTRVESQGLQCLWVGWADLQRGLHGSHIGRSGSSGLLRCRYGRTTAWIRPPASLQGMGAATGIETPANARLKVRLPARCCCCEDRMPVAVDSGECEVVNFCVLLKHLSIVMQTASIKLEKHFFLFTF